MRALLSCADLRVRIKILTRDTEDVLRRMDRTGITAALLDEYERHDTQVIRLRMELVDKLREELRAGSTDDHLQHDESCRSKPWASFGVEGEPDVENCERCRQIEARYREARGR